MNNGNLYKASDTTYRFRYSLDGKMYSKNFKAKNMTEAKKQANTFIQQINSHNYTDKSNMLFIELTALYFKDYFEPNFSHKVIVNRKQEFNSIILPILAQHKLVDITPTVINDVINKFMKYKKIRDKKPLSPNTIASLYSHLRAVLNYAVRMEYISSNPCDKAKLNIEKKIKKEIHFYTLEESKIFLKALDKESLDVKLALYIALYMGLRKSEIYGIKWSDIDKNNILHIQRSRIKLNGEEFVDKTKTLESNRYIAIPEKIVKLLEEKEHTNTYIFENVDNSLIYKLHRIQKENNLPEIRLHDLRHTCGTLLLSQGVDVKTVSELLGHSNLNTTSIYVHSLDDKFKSTTDLMNNILK